LFRARPPRELSFGFGDGAYKRTFGNAAYEVCSLYVVQNARWRFILGVQQALNTTYALGRAAVTRLRLDQTVRRLLKRQR
jgi:CelD/BcsL family acetyltransferase involved in cellulose biosynthesis